MYTVHEQALGWLWMFFCFLGIWTPATWKMIQHISIYILVYLECHKIKHVSEIGKYSGGTADQGVVVCKQSSPPLRKKKCISCWFLLCHLISKFSHRLLYTSDCLPNIISLAGGSMPKCELIILLPLWSQLMNTFESPLWSTSGDDIIWISSRRELNLSVHQLGMRFWRA